MGETHNTVAENATIGLFHDRTKDGGTTNGKERNRKKETRGRAGIKNNRKDARGGNKKNKKHGPLQTTMGVSWRKKK